MISIEKCKKVLKKKKYSDEEIKKIRDMLYSFASLSLDQKVKSKEDESFND